MQWLQKKGSWWCLCIQYNSSCDRAQCCMSFEGNKGDVDWTRLYSLSRTVIFKPSYVTFRMWNGLQTGVFIENTCAKRHYMVCIPSRGWGKP